MRPQDDILASLGAKGDKERRTRRRQLVGVGIGLVLITFLIYYSESQQLAHFATLRYLFLIPIAYIALNYGQQYGLGLSLLITSLFIPLLVIVLMREGPTSSVAIELVITLVLFNALAYFGGALADHQVLQKEHYRTLNHLGEQFSRELDRDELAHVILSETAQALYAESGQLLLCGAPGQLHLIAQTGDVPRPRRKGHLQEKTAFKNITEWIMAHGSLIQLEYPDVDPRFQVIDTHPLVRNLIAAPLRRAGEPFGVLLLYNRHIGTFSSQDAGLLEEIVIKSETALENAQLYHTLEKRVQQRTRDLMQEKNKLNVVLRSIADALVVTNPGGEITLLNPVFAQLAGCPEQEILGRRLEQVLPISALNDLVTQAVAQPLNTQTDNFFLPGDKVFHASACTLKMDGTVLGVVAVLRDITQEAQVDRMKTDFISTVSHELRTPLTSVLGFAKLISKAFEKDVAPKVSDDDRKGQRAVQRISGNLDIIVAEGERLTRLINDVLDIAKMEAGRIEWHMQETDIGAVIRSAVAATFSLAKTKDLPVAVQVAQDLSTTWADHDRLIQVMTNLISNAIKFTDAGQITIRATQAHVQSDGTCDVAWVNLPNLTPGEWLAVSVQDTGVGIAEKDLPQVFERFKQVGEYRTDRPKGTGLGLPISKEIIEHHGGQLGVDSELGVGSTFTFVLPATPQKIPHMSLLDEIRRRVFETLPRTTQTGQRILVVDDEANIRTLLRQELEDAGYRVTEAADGAQALRQVRQALPDLIILDIRMPGLSGLDVTSVLKNDPHTADIPILMLSIIRDRELGIRLGADDYLTKPLDAQKLLASVATLLARTERKQGRKKVLIIERDAAIVQDVSRILYEQGYEVVKAHNGNEGLVKARSEQPDLVIMDATLSQVNDCELLRALRYKAETCQAGVILLTAMS